VVSIKIASPAGAWGGGDDRNAPNCLWLIESRVRSDGTPAHPRGFLTLDGSSDAGLSEVREDSFLWVAISPRYSAIRQSAAGSSRATYADLLYNFSWRSSAASVSPRLSWDTTALESRSFSPAVNRWRRPRSCCCCRHRTRLGLRWRRALFRWSLSCCWCSASFRNTSTPVPPPSPWLSCRKPGRTCRAPRARQRLFNICTTQYLHNRRPGLHQVAWGTIATNRYRNLGVCCVSAPSSPPKSARHRPSHAYARGYEITRVWGERPPPPVRWRHETLNGAPPRAQEEKKKKRREEKKKKRDARKPSGKPW